MSTSDMNYHERLADAIGDTPLVRLGRVAGDVAPLVLAKVEYMNPGGSVKDRIAIRMLDAAEADGRLRPGGTIIEPTSGNTGVGLAIVAQQRDYRCIFTCPDKVSEDKRNVLSAFGATVVVCPAGVPPTHPDSYRSVAARLAAEIPGGCQLNQYANHDNPRSHYHGTGPEIWRQTAGRITCLVAGLGTGGTITGTGRFLKEISDGRVRVVGADPDGSVYGGATVARPYLLEGVGQPSLPPIYDPAVPDEIVTVSDADAFALTRRLAREEALLVGPSGGMAVGAALRAAATMSTDDVIVVILPDSGRGYLSKVYDDRWMARHGFLDTAGVETCRIALTADAPMPTLTPDHTLGDAVAAFAAHRLPALPVVTAAPPVRAAEICGSVSEAAVLAAIADDPANAAAAVGLFMETPLPCAGAGQALTEAAALLAGAGVAALSVLDAGMLRGVIGHHQVLAALTGRNGSAVPGNTVPAHPMETRT